MDPVALRTLKAHVTSRARLVIAAGLAAAALRCGSTVPRERTFESVLEATREATGIEATTAAWEPSRGRLADLVSGRPLLLSGRQEGASEHDVFRVFVRVAPDGAPLEVGRHYNLTHTALADERALLVRGPLAAYGTVAFEHVQSLTVLDGRGVYGAGQGDTWAERALHRLELGVQSLLEVGTLRGFGRTDIEFEHPPSELSFELSPSELRVAVGEHEWTLASGEQGLALVSPGGKDPSGEGPSGEGERLVVLPRHSPPKPVFHWLADAGRNVLGPGAIGWLEGRVFVALDHLRRFRYGLAGASDEPGELAAADAATHPASESLVEQAGAETGDPTWPPARLPSTWKNPRPGEGEWQAVDLPFLRRTPGAEDAPPYFYRTFVRPDRERPYAEVVLVAMDMRRLELGMEAGYEDPRPSAGPPGTGHVPEDPESYRRIVATFNGAFKTTHGDYGMVVNRRVLVPPVPGAATVRVDANGAVGLGTWPAPPPDAAGTTPPLAPDVVSLRQNLDPLIEGDRLNPAGRKVWGSQLYGQGVAAERSALCVTRAGHLVYAWSEEASGETLGEALRQAGCDYGIHLDMNPGHCAFVFTNIRDFQRVEADTQVLDPRMRINPKRYIRWSPKDFFYVSLRDPLPKTPGISWSPAPGPQGEPSWLPGILQGKVRVGPLEVELHRFQADRVRWAAAAGRGEPVASGARGPEPSEAELGRVLVAIGLGHSTRAARHGLAFGTRQLVPLNPALATLVLAPDAPPRLEAPGTPLRPTEGQTLVQLPVLAQDGELTARAREPGALRQRGALCVDGEGNVLLARLVHDSSGPLAQSLLGLGCGLVVEVDRGSQHPSFVERAGTSNPPRRGHETTVLHGFSRPATPRAYWWRPESP